MGRNYKKNWYETGLGKGVIALSVLFIIVGAYNYGYFNFTGVIPPTTGTDMVAFKVSVAEFVDPAHAASDVAVYAYKDNNGAVGEFIQTVTASSGIATFTTQVLEGSYIWLQARQAAPASATHYITAVEKFRVGFGDPTDTVSLTNAATGSNFLYVDEVCDTAPTFVAYNSSWYAVNTTANFEVLTGETTLNFRITMATADTDERYGGNSFTDYTSAAKNEYLGGVWLVLKCNTSAAFANYYSMFVEASYTYYVFKVTDYLYQATGDAEDKPSVTYAVSLISGADWTADTVIVADIYDLCQIIGGGITSSACFIDEHNIAPTAETFDVNN